MRIVRVAVVVAVAWLVAVVGLPVDAGTPVAGAAQEAGAGIDPGPPARPPVPVEAPAAPAGDEDAPFVAPPVVVPRAGTATVALGTGGVIPAGELPVAVGPARGAPRDGGRASVRVTTLDQAAVRVVGARFLAFTLTSRTARSASLEVDYGGFAHAFGGNFASRLRLVRFPACAVERPTDRACATPTPVATTNDLATTTLSAPSVTVDAGDTGPTAGVYAVTSGPVSEAGSYTATPLSASQSWEVGTQSGGFTWSYPVPVPPAAVGPTPALSLDYSSQAVDGLTAKSNTQSGVTGVGWSLGGIGFIERSYRPCNEDGWWAVDLCWYAENGENATISLNGHADELVPTSDPNVWRLRRDPGWKVERRFDSGDNDDNDDEWWKVTTPDGYRYYFGIGIEVGTSPAVPTNSVFTVPVFGDDAGEPCHGSSFSASRCDQAWRWNLDRIQDPAGNFTTVFYATESNWYGAEANQAPPRQYDRGGYPVRIEYSLRDGDQTAPAQVVFGYQDRCASHLTGSASGCPWPSSANASDWPDVPVDMICASTSCPNHSPTFFLTRALASVTTQTWDGTTLRTVDRVELDYTFPAKADGRDPILWLSTFQRVADPGGPGELRMPVVDPSGVQLDNHRPEYPRFTAHRVGKLVDEYGTEIQVTYGQPDGCAPPGWAWDNNRTDCFPVPYTRDDDGDPVFVVNKRYLVTKVVQRDLVNSAWASKQWVYDYGDAHTTPVAFWHDDDDLVTPDDLQTWSDWRGHSLVTVTFGNGPTVTRTEHRYFTGMHGDDTGSGARTATLVDAHGGQVADENWFAGQVREVRRMSASTGLWYTDTRHTYTATTPVTPAAGRSIRQILETVTQTWTSTSSGTPVETRVETDHDAYGLPVAVWDWGQVGVSGDARCTNYTYARNTTSPNWLTSLVATEVVTDGSPASGQTACGGNVVSRAETFYDGHTSLTTPPTKGLPTRELAYDSPTHAVETTTSYDTYGRIVAETNGLGRTTTTAYTPSDHGLTSTVTVTGPPPFSYRTTRTLEPRRQQVVAETDQNDRTTTSAYDSLGRLVSVHLPTEAGGSPSYRFAYHPLDRTDPANPKGWRVSAEQLLTSSGGTDVYVASWTYYDGFARVREVQTASPSGTGRVVVATRYDDRGLVAAETQPFAVTGALGDGLANLGGTVETRYTYDEVERVRTTETWGRPGGTGTIAHQWSATTTYDGLTRLDQTPEGRRTATTTDVRDQVVRIEEQTVTGATYSTTTFAHTTRGELHRITDNLGNQTVLGYDLLGRRTSITDPDTGLWTFAYDDNGNVVRTTDGLGAEIHTLYDELDRPRERRAGSASGTLLTSWTYWGAPYHGQVESTTVYDGADAYTVSFPAYDDRYRPTAKTVTVPASAGSGLAGTWTTSYAYDAAGNLRSTTLPAVGSVLAAEEVALGYTALGVPETLTGTLGGTATTYLSGTTYRADGKVAGRVLGAGPDAVTRAYTYDDTGRLARMTGSTSATTFLDEAFAYDDDGNVLRVDEATNAAQAQCFNYDDRARLTQAWTTTSPACTDFAAPATGGAGPYRHAYTYDTIGNLTSATKSSTTRTYGYGGADGGPHAVTSVTPGTAGTAADTYAYDDNGAMTARTIGGVASTMAWTADHRLRTVTQGTQVTTSITGPDGQRLLRREPNGATTLYLDGQEIRRAANGNLRATRHYSAGGVTVAVRSGTTLSWYLGNHQGSAAATVTAGVAAIRRYLPFGGPRGTTGTLTTTRGFLGHVEDTAAGLVDLGARFYDPDLGRFVSVDPVATPGDPQNLNPYSYAGNNPTSASDPSGLRSMCMCGWATPPPPPPNVPRNAGYEPRRYRPPTRTKAWTRRHINRTVVDGATIAHHKNARLTFNHGYEYDAVHGGWGEQANYTWETGGGGLAVAMFFPLRFAIEPALDCGADFSLGNCTGAIVEGGAMVAAPGIGRALTAGARRLAASAASRFLTGSASQAIAGADDAASIISRTAQGQSARGAQALQSYLSPAEQAAYAGAPARGSRFLGQGVHRATRDALDEAYPGRFIYRARGVDFVDTWTGEMIELTTPGQVASHMARPGYRGASYATYWLP